MADATGGNSNGSPAVAEGADVGDGDGGGDREVRLLLIGGKTRQHDGWCCCCRRRCESRYRRRWEPRWKTHSCGLRSK